ncbi:MAG: hypothetical protein AAGK09_05140 [Planctomycetota bacterium]
MPLAQSTTRDPLSRVTPDDRPRLVTVDAAVLDAVVSVDERSTPAKSRPTVVAVDEAVAGLRADVRDAARAVLTWLAVVTDHRVVTGPRQAGRGDGGLDRVLRRCVRPGTGLDGLDYTALADEVWRTTNVRLSAKRVQTAIRHLRQARLVSDRQADKANASRAGFDGLLMSLDTPSAGPDSPAERWALAADVLAAVRLAVSRLITHDFAEGVEPGAAPEAELAERFAAFDAGANGAWRRTLIDTIIRHDGTAESDVRLVLAGAAAVRRLAGAGTLVDTVAQLNVAVAGRDLTDTPTYVRRMLRVARLADRVARDPASKTELNRARRQADADHRLPSPTRVMSYALNNAATRAIERVFLGEAPADQSARLLRLAAAAIARMQRRDSGFQLIPVTRALHAAVGGTADGFWRSIRADNAAALLADVARFDNCRPLVDAVFADARRSHPAAADAVIRV